MAAVRTADFVMCFICLFCFSNSASRELNDLGRTKSVCVKQVCLLGDTHEEAEWCCNFLTFCTKKVADSFILPSFPSTATISTLG